MLCKIYFGLSDSVKLVNSFNIVILIDTMYKKNKYMGICCGL